MNMNPCYFQNRYPAIMSIDITMGLVSHSRMRRHDLHLLTFPARFRVLLLKPENLPIRRVSIAAVLKFRVAIEILVYLLYLEFGW